MPEMFEVNLAALSPHNLDAIERVLKKQLKANNALIISGLAKRPDITLSNSQSIITSLYQIERWFNRKE